jgi:hypothetical protein
LGLIAENDGEDVITLGSDRKIKLWHKGTLVAKFVRIRGDFTAQLPVTLRRVGRVVYYTAEDGVYCVLLPMEVEDIHGKLRLAAYAGAKS